MLNSCGSVSLAIIIVLGKKAISIKLDKGLADFRCLMSQPNGPISAGY